MVYLEELVSYLDEYMEIDRIQDYCPNGLQVEGSPKIKRIATSVSANLEFFEKALDYGANALLVHHGVLWDFHSRVLKGSYKDRIQFLLQNNISLIAYHLPLDAHHKIGNNIISCLNLGVKNPEKFGEYKNVPIGYQGKIDPVSPADFKKRVDQYFNHQSIMFDYGTDSIQSVGIISGAAQSEFLQAIEMGLDCYITGEVSEHTMHLAKEEKTHFIAAGHYAGERVGVNALGEHVAEKFNCEVKFIDVPVPV